MYRMLFLVLPACFWLVLPVARPADPPLPKAPGPLTPQQEQKTFRIDERFRIDLVACEPAVVDPVAMCFDERGRLFVCEMRGYPNGGVGTGNETRGRIQCLTDQDGDGYFETVTTFAEGLRFPTGVTPYRGGIIVAVAPDVVYLEDTDGDNRADRKTVLYTGFDLSNIEQLVNSLQWGLDNWIYGTGGGAGGTITSPQNPRMPPVTLRNRGIRFRPDRPGSLEPVSSGGQYGLTADDFQRWFTATNSQHLRQIVLPEHYLKRNPHLPVAAVTLDIPEHGPAAKVFRISEFEPWRVERTRRRAGGPDAKRFPSTELVPGGYFTSACSPLIYTADLFGPEFYGNNFVCDPANNLIHRELLKENGAVFRAVRAYPDREFLASTDTWFRPVFLATGPDGAIYVLDFYREVIETPLSLPEDLKRQVNLESRDRGRIWRIAPKDFRPSKLPDWSAKRSEELVDELLSPNPWRRLTAQRLLVERRAESVVADVRKRLGTAAGSPARANLLWTLHELRGLTADDVRAALDDPNPGVREQALRLAEDFLPHSAELKQKLAGLVNDPSPRVRFQLAFSAGTLPPADAAPVLAELLVRDGGDIWTVTAALSSASGCGPDLLQRLARTQPPAPASLLQQLAGVIGAKGDVAEIAGVLGLAAEGAPAAVLEGLSQGMRASRAPLTAWWADPPAEARAALNRLRPRFEAAARVACDESAGAGERVAAAAALAHGPFELAARLADVLVPTTPGDVQVAAVRTLSRHTDPGVAELLLKHWPGYGPALRREVLDALLARPERVAKLLEAIESRRVAANELTPAQVQQLQNHPAPTVRAKAASVLRRGETDRARVVRDYLPALQLTGDADKGRIVFQKSCSACHRLDGVGHDVGANLQAALPSKSGEELLIAIFDPNREVDPRYLSYTVVTADERVLQGVVAAESPSSITLRMAEGKEEVILRSNITSLRSAAVSLMPTGLEKDLTPQDVADLLAFLRKAGR